MHSPGGATGNWIPTVGLHTHLSCSTMSKQGTAEEIWNRSWHFSSDNTKRKINIKCISELCPLHSGSWASLKPSAQAAQVEEVLVGHHSHTHFHQSTAGTWKSKSLNRSAIPRRVIPWAGFPILYLFPQPGGGGFVQYHSQGEGWHEAWFPSDPHLWSWCSLHRTPLPDSHLQIPWGSERAGWRGEERAYVHSFFKNPNYSSYLKLFCYNN